MSANTPVLPATLWVCAVILGAGLLAAPSSPAGWAALATCAVLPPLVVAQHRGRAATARRARSQRLARDERRIGTLAPLDGPPLEILRERLAAARRDGRRDDAERTELQINARQSANDFR